MIIDNIDSQELIFGQTIGNNINTVETAINFFANIILWLGWGIIVAGSFLIITKLIFKLVGTESSLAIKEVNLGVTQLVMLIITGIFFVSSGFFISSVASVFGIEIEGFNNTEINNIDIETESTNDENLINSPTSPGRISCDFGTYYNLELGECVNE